MARPTRKVTGFFGLEPGDDFFTIEDPVKGIIEGDYGIAGDVGTDISQYVREISITRGRSRQFDEISTGTAVITLDNRTRAFDSLHDTSPFAGTLVPKKLFDIKVNGHEVFTGAVEKYGLRYRRNVVPETVVTLSDCLADLADTRMEAWTPTAGDTPAERITDVLNRPEINFGANRDLDEGVFTLGGYAIDDGTNGLAYLKLVGKSDFARLFASRKNVLTFRDRFSGSTTTPELMFVTNTTGVLDVERESGIDTLFNRVVASRVGGSTERFENAESQGQYGIIEFPGLTGLLVETDAMATSYAEYIATTYAEPEDRFSSVNFQLYGLPTLLQTQIAQLDIGSIVHGTFYVGGVGDPVERLAVVEGIKHSIRRNSHLVTLSFGDPVNRSVFTVEDDVLGLIEGVGRIAF